MPQTDIQNCFATYLPSTTRIKKNFLVYSLFPILRNHKQDTCISLIASDLVQETLYNERHTQHENIIVLFQTFCQSIDSKIIRTEEKNIINSKNLRGSTTTLLSFALFMDCQFIMPSNDGTSVDSNFMTILFLNGTRQSLLAIWFEITLIFFTLY